MPSRKSTVIIPHRSTRVTCCLSRAACHMLLLVVALSGCCFFGSFKRYCAAVAEGSLCQGAQACGAYVLSGFGAAWEAAVSQGAVGAGAVLVGAPTVVECVCKEYRTCISSLDAVTRMQESPSHKRFLVGCSSPFMRLAEHLTAVRAWC